MSIDRYHQKRSCDWKHQYATAEEAYATIQDVPDEDNSRPTRPWVVYRCIYSEPGHEHFHKGHLPRDPDDRRGEILYTTMPSDGHLGGVRIP